MSGSGKPAQSKTCAYAERLLAGRSPLSVPTNYFVLEYDVRARFGTRKTKTRRWR